MLSTLTRASLHGEKNVTITNIGNSVATAVVSPMEMFLADNADKMFNEPLKRQKEFCDKLGKPPMSHRPGSMEGVIFPNDSDSSVGYGLGLSKAEVDAAKDGRIGVKGANVTGPKIARTHRLRMCRLCIRDV